MYFGRTRRVGSPYGWASRIPRFGAVTILAALTAGQALGQGPSQHKVQRAAKAPAAGHAAVPAAGARSALAPQAAKPQAAAKSTVVSNQCTELLQMAKTLKAEVDKTTVNVLSVAVVKEAAQIQKYAHTMHNRFKSNAKRR